MDKFGYPHSEEMRLEERYRRVDAETLELVMTITDPVVYAKPWSSDTKRMKLNREKAKRWDEQIYCVPVRGVPVPAADSVRQRHRALACGADCDLPNPAYTASTCRNAFGFEKVRS